MSQIFKEGKISFIHHEKLRAVIEYSENGKLKNVQGAIDDKAQEKTIEEKLAKKTHRFMIGDSVKFLLKKTGKNGSVLYADKIVYLYNNSLEVLLNKAALQNKFLGYIKITGSEFFIKEIDSYLIFPLKTGAFEIAPTEADTVKPVAFKLENTGKPEKIYASLYNHNYIPEFPVLVEHYKKKATLSATVKHVSPYAIHLQLLHGNVTAKINIDETLMEKIKQNLMEQGTIMNVLITHLDTNRIVVKPAETPTGIQE